MLSNIGGLYAMVDHGSEIPFIILPHVKFVCFCGGHFGIYLLGTFARSPVVRREEQRHNARWLP